MTRMCLLHHSRPTRAPSLPPPLPPYSPSSPHLSPCFCSLYIPKTDTVSLDMRQVLRSIPAGFSGDGEMGEVASTECLRDSATTSKPTTRYVVSDGRGMGTYVIYMSYIE